MISGHQLQRRAPRVGPWLALAAIYTASALTVSRDELTADWFSDEMWRANFVHSPRWWQLYRSWDTPTPPGFVYAYRTLDRVTSTGPFTLRLTVLATLVVGLLVMTRLLFALIATRQSSPSAAQAQKIGAVASCGIAPMLSAFGVHRIFAPYMAEFAVGALLLLGCVLIDQRRWAWPLVLGALIVAPLFTIGPLFLFPSVCVIVLRWAWADPSRRRQHVGLSLGAFAAAAGVAIGVYLIAYRPVAKDSISSYWAGTSLKDNPGGLRHLFAQSMRLWRDGLTSWARVPTTGESGWVTMAFCLGCLAVGLRSLTRAWRPLPWVISSAWLGIAIASLGSGWPLTPERVNLAVVAVTWIAALYGGFRIVAIIARSQWLTVALVAVMTVAAIWPTRKTELFGQAFLRGMTPDLAAIAASPADENLVIAYHFATRWYVEDALITPQRGGRSYEMVYETYSDLSVYDPAYLDGLIAPLPAGTAVWCVMAFDIGPDNAAKACLLPTRLVKFAEHEGQRSLIRGYLVP